MKLDNHNLNHGVYAFFEQNSIGYAICDENGYFLKINNSFSKLLGYDNNELTNSSLEKIVYPSVWYQYQNYINELILGDKEVITHKAKLINKNTLEIELELHLSSIMFEDNRVIQIIANEIIDKEILDKKFQLVFEAANVGKSITLPNGEINVNKAFCDMLGYSKEELKHKKWQDITPSDEIETVQNKLNELLSGKKDSVKFNKRYIHKDGFYVWTDLNIVIHRDIHNKPLYFIATIVDISQQRRIEEKLKENEEKLNKNLDELYAIINALPGIVSVIDTDYNVLVANDEVFERFGQGNLHDIIGKPCYKTRKLIDHPCSQCSFPEVFKTGQSIIRFSTHDEEKQMGISTKAYAVPLKDKNGKIWGGVEVIMDISDIRKIDEALVESEEKLRLALESAVADNWEMNLITGEMYYSRSWAEHLGYQPGEIPYTIEGITQITHTDDVQRNLKELDMYLLGKKPLYETETRVRRKDGSYAWLLSRGKLVEADDNGKPVRLIGTNIDITERKHAEDLLISKTIEYQLLSKEYQFLNRELDKNIKRLQEMNIQLEKSKEKAEESDRLKSIFLANMSHEVRTPLNAIMGFSGLLNESDVTEEKMNMYIDIIQNSGLRLSKLIDDILDISKIESGQFSLNPKDFYPYKTIENSIEIFKNSNLLLDKREVKLLMDYPVDFKYKMINTDEYRFQQVLDNLISNAIKYTNKGSISIGVEFEIEKDVENILVIVRDTGLGIPRDKHSLIFERFRQVEEQGYHVGTGLGLSIARGIVHFLGGKMWFESEVNIGTTFFFSIPVGNKQVMETREDLNEVNIFNLDDKTIVIAEDDYDSFSLLRLMLEEYNAKIVHAKNGKVLMDLLKEATPDLILLDINMPEKTGFECLKEIRTSGIKTKIIAQTALAMESEKEKCLSSGCDGYISKPITSKRLFKVISEVLSGN